MAGLGCGGSTVIQRPWGASFWGSGPEQGQLVCQEWRCILIPGDQETESGEPPRQHRGGKGYRLSSKEHLL